MTRARPARFPSAAGRASIRHRPEPGAGDHVGCDVHTLGRGAAIGGGLSEVTGPRRDVEQPPPAQLAECVEERTEGLACPAEDDVIVGRRVAAPTVAF